MGKITKLIDSIDSANNIAVKLKINTKQYYAYVDAEVFENTKYISAHLKRDKYKQKSIIELGSINLNNTNEEQLIEEQNIIKKYRITIYN
ncbi:MAG: hypothetical protein RSE41_00535 [Clostridia bacterium]